MQLNEETGWDGKYAGQDEVLFEQSEEVCRSQTLVLTGDFNLPAWKGSTLGGKQCEECLECVGQFLNADAT